MSDRIKVCFVIENLLPAGTELWTVRLIEAMDRTRFQPFLCLLHGQSELSRSLEPSDCDVIRLELTKLKSTRGIQAAGRFYRFLRSNHIDVVQVHHADPAYFAVPIAKFAGAKVVQTKYDTGYWLSGVHLWIHRVLRRFVDATVANCEACKQASIEQEWSPQASVTVLQNGIAIEQFEALPSLRMPRSHEAAHFGMVCNLRAVKSPELFVTAARRVLDVHPNSHFHIAGDGELRQTLEETIARLRLNHAFTLHGDVKDIPRFLNDIHVAVLCSQTEGLSHAVLEYMAAGRAIIATAVGGNRELIQDQLYGVLIPPNDVAALSAAMCHFLGNPDQAETFAKAARESVRETYSFQAMTNRFESFYFDLVFPRRHRPDARGASFAKAEQGVS